MSTNPVNISQLPPLTPVLQSLLEVDQGGMSGKVTLQDIFTLLAQNLAIRQTTQISAPAGGSAVEGEAAMASLFFLLHIASDSPGRLRLYATAAERDADRNRTALTDPPPGTGCLFEGTTSSTLTGWDCSPIPTIQCAESPITNQIAYRLEPASTAACNFTLTYRVIDP